MTTTAGPGRLLAVDLGGTRVKAAAIWPAAAGRPASVHTSANRPTPTSGATAALQVVADLGHHLAGGHPWNGVALCVPGLVAEDGRVLALPGKLAGITEVDLTSYLGEEFAAPAFVCNDAIAYGVGEASCGAGSDYSRVVVVTIGTGVGVSVLEDGLPVTRGPLGGGILSGQIPISDLAGSDLADGGAARDSNGQAGTIEALCAASQIVACCLAAGGDYQQVEQVWQAYRDGAPTALAGVAVYRHRLAQALVALAQAHAPSAVVLGGGPINADCPLFDGLAEAVTSRLWPGHQLAVRPATLGDAAALLGLAQLHAAAHPATQLPSAAQLHPAAR
ncbi:MAG: ROK family protein, partial [Mycobacteriales bacterium]